jgi:hypothetical protein
MHYLIIGMGKTGTTVMYHALKTALPPETKSLFEPRSRQEWQPIFEANSKYTITKCLMQRLIASDVNLDIFYRIVILVRDPRDQIISRVLQWSAQMAKYNPLLRDTIIKIFENKRKHPLDYPFIEIIDRLSFLNGQYFPKNTIQEFGDRLKDAVLFFPEISNAYIQKYENLVDQKISGLKKYLDLEINTDIIVPEKFSHVERTRSYGDWVNWLLKEDLEVLIPYIKEYSNIFGYDLGEFPSGSPDITFESSSGYIERVCK